MTVGKDVSGLFTDVINCMQTGNIELKKLVYLYLINYAKSNPDLAILAVNTFQRDANDPNPLIRALSIRTMGCIRVDRIAEYLCEPLRRCLRDEDPYVRKTAAVCVAKLFDINPELVEDQGFLDMLRDLISDSNPTVVANAVAALSEIAETSGRDVFLVTTSVLQKLLAALNECTEWGQVFILDCLARYTPQDGREAEGIIERVTPRLQHVNSAVVLSAVKVVMHYLEVVTNQDSIRTLTRKLAPPLVTLLSTEPEIQYVALRNINLIVQKRPNILSHEIKVFFCKYNDPIYVKMEKLEIIIRLVGDRNVDQVLLELKEYATEVDVDFVRRSVRAIGRCAIKLERAAERCINVLLELIQTKVNYVVQESVIVIKDIFRRYPNRYESIIATLCENLDTLDEPEAKASMVWIVGEYAERIDNADELLETFLDGFHDETAAVQLQLLTATVKLFLKRPTDTQDMVQRVLNMATEDSDNPDLRDRGYIYWRLLSTNPEAAKAVVLAEKPVIADDTFSLEPTLLDSLVGQIATLASIYHKPPESFVMRGAVTLPAPEVEDEFEAGEGGGLNSSNYGGEGGDGEGGSLATADGGASGGGGGGGGGAVDLLDMGGLDLGGGGGGGGAGGGMDLLGRGMGGAPAAAAQLPLIVTAEQGQGVQLRGLILRRNGQMVLEVEAENVSSGQPLQQLAVQFNKSSFGLVPAQPAIVFPAPVPVGGRAQGSLPLVPNPAFFAQGAPPSLQLQAAMKNMSTQAVFYFALAVPLQALLTEDGGVERGAFVQTWKGMDESKEVYHNMPMAASVNVDAVTQKLGACNVFHIARRSLPDGQEICYYSAKILTGLALLLELTFQPGGLKLCVKCDQPAVAPLVVQAVDGIIRS